MNTENNNQEETVVPETTTEETTPEVETISIPKADYDKLNQTLGSLKRENKDLKKPKETSVETTSTKETKTEGLGYAEKAFLVANGVKGADEIALVEKAMKSTGDSLESVLENDFFQGKLKSLRDGKAAIAATPSGTRRSAQQPATDTVEYWSEKYATGTPITDIPDAMQIKVINAKIAKEKSSGSNFSKNPVISG